jgi:hypothetical protein
MHQKKKVLQIYKHIKPATFSILRYPSPTGLTSGRNITLKIAFFVKHRFVKDAAQEIRNGARNTAIEETSVKVKLSSPCRNEKG